MVPLWLSTPLIVLKRALRAASNAALRNCGLTVFVRLFMLVLTTRPCGSTTIVTTTRPSSCTLYIGIGSPPGPNERPFKSYVPVPPTPVAFPVSLFPVGLP